MSSHDLKKIYKADSLVDLSSVPFPKFELLNNKKSVGAIKAFLEGEPIEWMTKYKRKK